MDEKTLVLTTYTLNNEEIYCTFNKFSGNKEMILLYNHRINWKVEIN